MIRARLLKAFEAAETTADQARREELSRPWSSAEALEAGVVTAGGERIVCANAVWGRESELRLRPPG